MIRDAIMGKIQFIETACLLQKTQNKETKKRQMKQRNESVRYTWLSLVHTERLRLRLMQQEIGYVKVYSQRQLAAELTFGMGLGPIFQCHCKHHSAWIEQFKNY